MRYRFLVVWLACFLMMPFMAEAKKKSLTVGVSATYTGFAAGAASVSDGIIDYLKWLGSRGGVAYKDPETGKMDKVGIKVIWEDNQYNVAKSVAAYKRFKARGADIITGIGSTPGEACAANASRDKLPYLSWYAYASPAGHKPKPQYYWTCAATICEGITPMIKWLVKERLKEKGKPRVGLMAMDVPSWRVLGKPGMMDKYIAGIGGELAGIEFMPAMTTDLSLPITRLVKDKKADGIVHIGAISHTVVFAKDLRRVGIDPDQFPVVCNLSSFDETLFKAIPNEIEGLHGETSSASPDADSPGMEKLRQVARWAGRPKEAVNLNYIAGFLGSMVIEEAVKRACEKSGYDAVAKSGEILRDELHNFKEMDTQGVAPEVGVKYPDVEPFYFNYARVIQARDGKFHGISDWIPVDIIEGAIE